MTKLKMKNYRNTLRALFAALLVFALLLSAIPVFAEPETAAEEMKSFIDNLDKE